MRFLRKRKKSKFYAFYTLLLIFTFMRFLWAAVKEGIPSSDELEHLSVEVDDWEKLGRRLGFTPAELTALHKDKETWSEKARAMLMRWRERNGSDATYRCLYDALSHDLMNRKDLAEEFCCWCSKSYTGEVFKHLT